MLDWDVTVAVLMAAAAHAGWNALIKRGSDPLLETTLMHGSVALPAALAILLWSVPLPQGDALWCMLASAGVHCLYFHALSAAYRHGDLSVAYPVMRGSAPLLTAIAAGLFLHEWPHPLGWVGIALICAGVLAIGRANSQTTDPSTRRRTLSWALITAATIVAYTTIDSIGARRASSPWAYTLWLAVVEGILLFAVVWIRQGHRLIRYGIGRGMRPMTAGVVSMLSYAVALWGMTRAPVASVAALRETSVLFAMVIAAIVLGERVGRTRWIGAMTIVLGIIALRVS